MNVKRAYGDKGHYLGYVNEDSTNVRVYDDKGKPVDTYNKTSDQTYNDKGGRSTFGNTVVESVRVQRAAHLRGVAYDLALVARAIVFVLMLRIWRCSKPRGRMYACAPFSHHDERPSWEMKKSKARSVPA